MPKISPALFALGLCAAACVPAAPIAPGQLSATLLTGSLAGVSFPVSFTYDAGLVNPSGDSFIMLSSINFTLLGVPFTQANIFQGGQVMTHNGLLENLMASFQGPVLPPNPPVRNITFGFGGPQVIGYTDLNGQFGNGSFTIASAPEPSTFGTALAFGMIFGFIAGLRRRAGNWRVSVRPFGRNANSDAG